MALVACLKVCRCPWLGWGSFVTRIFIRDVAEPGFRGSSLSLVLLRCTEQGQESRETPLRREVALTGWGLLEKRLPLGADSLSLEESVHPVPGNFPWDSRSWAGTGGRECHTVWWENWSSRKCCWRGQVLESHTLRLCTAPP